MRIFLIACLAVVVVAIAAAVSLNSVQKPSGTRYTTEGARIHPTWSFRQVFSKTKNAPQTVAMATPTSDNVREEGCEVPSAWALIVADFSDSPTGEYLCEH